MKKLKNKIKELPRSPGVYYFYDADGKLLYIGKAASLRARVGSYFFVTSLSRDGACPGSTRTGGSAKTQMLVNKIADVKIKKTDSVLEALILEANEIKKFQPLYNVRAKDDKSFCNIVITEEEFPRVLVSRPTDKMDVKIKKTYGPYTSAKFAREAIKILKKIFPFHSSKEKSEKKCLDFHIGLCPGPYAGAISREDYIKNIKRIEAVLKGKKKGVVRDLEREMKKLADAALYEEAAKARDKIFALRHVQDVALVMDVSSPLSQRGVRLPHQKFWCSSRGDFSVVGIGNIEKVGDKEIRAKAVDNEEGLRAEKSPRFANANRPPLKKGVNPPPASCPRRRGAGRPIPRLPCGQPTPFGKGGKPHPIPRPATSAGRPPLEKGVTIVSRIEAYDISNISGKYAVGSMVVFMDGEVAKDEYRRFKIRTVQEANDVGMLREVLERRFKHQEWPMPDLILIDGGKAQVNAANKILDFRSVRQAQDKFEILDFEDRERQKRPIVIGVAKGPTRKKLDLYFAGGEIPPGPLLKKGENQIDKKLIAHIMSEAHRFAVSYHRLLRRKGMRG